jgi:osmotically-inducible protein OsmY
VADSAVKCACADARCKNGGAAARILHHVCWTNLNDWKIAVRKKTDSELKKDIEDELRCDPKVNAAQVGVSVDDGAVSLFGSVNTFAERWAAEDATKRVGGVCAVAQDIAVKLLSGDRHTDSEIAGATQHALKWNTFIPNTITANVKKGQVTLEGTATWNFERDVAVRTVGHLPGVTAVFNCVALKSQASTIEVKAKVLAALQRQAIADSQSIDVSTSGGKVTLTGHASSWKSMEDATSAAWSAAGVTDVSDEVKLDSSL